MQQDGSLSICLDRSKLIALHQQKRHINPLSTTSDDSTGGKDSSNKGEKEERHRDAEKEPLPEWPGGVNPHTGEKGGPKGPEPTRYGDWERKGRVTDF